MINDHWYKNLMLIDHPEIDDTKVFVPGVLVKRRSENYANCNDVGVVLDQHEKWGDIMIKVLWSSIPKSEKLYSTYYTYIELDFVLSEEKTVKNE